MRAASEDNGACDDGENIQCVAGGVVDGGDQGGCEAETLRPVTVVEGGVVLLLSLFEAFEVEGGESEESV